MLGGGHSGKSLRNQTNQTFPIKVSPQTPTSLVLGDLADLHRLPPHHVEHGLLLIGDVFYWHF